MMATMGIGNP